MYSINNLIATLLTVGGVGYINYYTLLHMGLIQTAKQETKHIIPICLVFSIFDFAIYLCLQEWLQKIPSLSLKVNSNWLIFWTIVSTMGLAFILTLCLGNCAVELFYKLVNKSRDQNNQAQLMQEEPFIDALNTGRQTQAYLYDFSHKPLGFGHVLSSSLDRDSNYQINLEPFEDDDAKEQYSYDQITTFMQSKDWQKAYTMTQHVNFKQGFIMILIEDKN